MKALVIGGTRFFGKRLVSLLLEAGGDVTILSRGREKDPFGARVRRIECDRTDRDAMKKAIAGRSFEVIFDQRCMNASDAEGAVEIFNGRAEFYIATSTLSVYGHGAAHSEGDFDASAHKFVDIADERSEYAEAKRQMENVFSKFAQFPVAFPRYPIVLGPDDYTKRLHFHVERISTGQPFSVPNPSARMGFISSTDAARSLQWLAKERIPGPMNFASPEPISIGELITKIESAIGKKANLRIESKDRSFQEFNSPFGIEDDWYMSVAKAQRAGFEASRLDSWMMPLVEELAKQAT